MIERGSIVGDKEGGSWRVLEVTREGLFMLQLPERRDIVHTRSVKWKDYEEFGYDLKFP